MPTKKRSQIVRKLDRPSPGPACLSNFRHGRNPWSDLKPQDRTQIWQHLVQMQGEFCAYCQCKIDPHSNKSHIEHFYQRNNFPRRTFDWNNLFGSCERKETCGNYKDNKAKNISPVDICKPDIHEPKDFLQFIPLSGKVEAKSGLNPTQNLIAKNTIKAFNLQHSSLVGRRRLAAQTERPSAKFLFECLEEFPNDSHLQQELQANISRINNEEFSAIRHAIWTA